MTSARLIAEKWARFEPLGEGHRAQLIEQAIVEALREAGLRVLCAIAAPREPVTLAAAKSIEAMYSEEKP